MIISGFPAFVEDILSRIPRIKRVSKIVALLAEDNFLLDREKRRKAWLPPSSASLKLTKTV